MRWRDLTTDGKWAVLGLAISLLVVLTGLVLLVLH